MKIEIDKDSSFIIEKKLGKSDTILFSIKTKQDLKTQTIITAEITNEILDDLIAKLISIKTES